MGTESTRKDPYNTEIQPSQKDKEQARIMYYQDGQYNVEAMAFEITKQRREDVEEKAKTDSMEETVTNIHSALMGNKDYKMLGMVETQRLQNEDQKTFNTVIITKLDNNSTMTNRIAGGTACIVVIAVIAVSIWAIYV